MSTRLKFAPNPLVLIELPIGNDVCAVVFAGDRLIAGSQINNAQSRMAEPNTIIPADPLPLSVRPAVIERLRCAFQRCRRNRLAARVDGHNSAHSCVLLAWWGFSRPERLNRKAGS